MYTSPDDDRSDLFLAGAVYVLGPTVVGLLLESLRVPTSLALSFVTTVALTVAVPAWLIRYRKQRLSEFGFDRSWSTFGVGFVAALPVAAAYMLASLVAGTGPLDRAPAWVAANTGSVVDLVLHVVSAYCVTLLAIYTTVKARTAFRSDPRYLRSTTLELSRYLAIAGAAATALLVLTFVMQGDDLRLAVEILAAPAGVVGVLYLLVRGLANSRLTSRPVLLTPMVVLAIGSIVILGGAFNFVFGIWRGAMLAGLGLAIGVLLESRRSAMGPLGLAAGLALLTPLLG